MSTRSTTKVLDAKTLTLRSRIMPRLKSCLDNALRTVPVPQCPYHAQKGQPLGSREMDLGSPLQGRLPRLGLGLSLALSRTFGADLRKHEGFQAGMLPVHSGHQDPMAGFGVTLRIVAFQTQTYADRAHNISSLAMQIASQIGHN